MTAIILVNWNGADDTIACLESLSCVEEPHFVVIADNASTDDSVERIHMWLDSHSNNINVKQYQLLSLDANYGFAVGNNKALAVAMQRNPDYCMLLNNDTEVEPDFLFRLVTFAAENPQYKVLSPCIRYYADKAKVWFSGGQLTYVSRKGLYSNADAESLPSEPFSISYLSGCALFFHPSVLNERNELLYNGFFFGEEDYEFALRMRKQGVEMMCVPQSVVYHKVGASQKNTNDNRGLGRIYMYYHNRLICARLHCGAVKFHLIRLLTCANCLRYFKFHTGSWCVSWKLVVRLIYDTTNKDGFGYADFRSLMFDGDYFSFDTQITK